SATARASAVLDRHGPAVRARCGTDCRHAAAAIPHCALGAPDIALAGRAASFDRAAVRPGRIHAGGRRDAADPRRAGTSVAAQSAQGGHAAGSGFGTRVQRRRGGGLLELVYALAIGVLSGSGVWLLLRPRTFQVLMGLTLLSYATNIFIFGMGRLALHKAPDRKSVVQ